MIDAITDKESVKIIDLWLSVLEVAIMDFYEDDILSYRVDGSKKKRYKLVDTKRNKTDAVIWFFDNEGSEISFVSLCKCFDIDYENIRQNLLECPTYKSFIKRGF